MQSGSTSACKLALDLNSIAVTLYFRTELDTWAAVGEAVLGAEDFSEQIDALRVEALVRGGENENVLLWLPPEQVISRTFQLAPGSEDAARTEATQKIANETDFEAAELTVAMADADDGKQTHVMGALLQTVHEAKEYGARWGFPNTIVSTRTQDPKFGPNGPLFEPPQTIVRQAGHAMRRLAIAATVLIAIGGAFYGGYQALQPLLEEPTDIRSSGPALASFAVVLDPISPEASPIEQVQIGGVGSLAIQRLLVSDAERLNAYGTPLHRGPFTSETPLGLSAPDEGAPMRVGGAPGQPAYQRPGRLSVVATLPAPPNATPVQAALDRIRTAGPPEDNLADTPAPSTQTAEDDRTTIEADRLASLAPPSVLVTTGSAEAQQSETAAPETQEPVPPESTGASPTEPLDGAPAVDTETEPDLEVSALAPEAMKDQPAGRPANFEKIVAAATPADLANAEPKSDAEPTDTVEANDTETEEAAVTASLVPTATPQTRPDIGSDAAADPEVEEDANQPTVFAALQAPAPSKRPKVFERAAKRPVSTQRNIAAVTVPRTVKSAARKTGLAMDETSLIGVIDARSGRKALVRMPSGDYRKVGKGDVLDGWRVSSISREAMRLTKRGQNRTLLLVSR